MKKTLAEQIEDRKAKVAAREAAAALEAEAAKMGASDEFANFEVPKVEEKPDKKSGHGVSKA